MVTIYLDESVKDVPPSTDPVYDDGNLTVRSGFSSMGSTPVIEFSFRKPLAYLKGGNAEKQRWIAATSTQAKVEYAWGLLLSSVTKDVLLAMLTDERESAHSQCRANVAKAVLDAINAA